MASSSPTNQARKKLADIRAEVDLKLHMPSSDPGDFSRVGLEAQSDFLDALDHIKGRMTQWGFNKDAWNIYHLFLAHIAEGADDVGAYFVSSNCVLQVIEDSQNISEGAT